MSREGCALPPFISLEYVEEDRGTSMIFNPECGCENCEEVRQDMIEILEKAGGGSQ